MEEIPAKIAYVLALAASEGQQVPWLPPWLIGALKLAAPILGILLALYAFHKNQKLQKKFHQEGLRLGEAKKAAEIAQGEAKKLRELADKRQEEADLRAGKVRALQEDLRQITDGREKLWNLRPNVRFREYYEWSRNPEGAKLVTIGHLKGGVGKTTIAANLAAYYAEHFKKPVLLIDLDYQGSLSNSLALAAEIEVVASLVDRLFEPSANLATVNRCRQHLTPVINRGWLIPASYPFAETDSRLLMRWLLPQDGDEKNVDVRYRLAHSLLRPEVREEYGLIIFDMPPRLTVGAVNALVASDYFVVPTLLDMLSVEAVPQFLSLLSELKADLELDLELAAIVPTLTVRQGLLRREIEAREKLFDMAKVTWASDVCVTAGHIPRRVGIAAAAGESVAYNVPGADGDGMRLIFDPVFAEILSRMGLKVPESHMNIVKEERQRLANGEADDNI